jgi:tripartite-type tricarboxylate transporter receptor subunit TctC
MNLPRRKFLRLAASAAALPVLSSLARAQTYPSRSVRLFVGYAAGGAPDILARLMGQWLSERFSQQFVIENRPGAGSSIATEAVVNATADGYTLLLASLANAVNASLYDKLNYNFMRDIVPVAGISQDANVMVVNTSFPIKTVPEFIAYAKAHPGQLSMASAGNGSSPHMAGELFKFIAGIDIVHVPYRGSPAALTDLLGGRVQVYFGPMSATIEYIKAAKIRALAITTRERSNALPNVPSLGDFVAGYEFSAFYGIGAPKNTPAEIIDKLNKEINAGLADPKLKARLADLGSSPFAGSPSDFRKFIADETEKWARVVKFAGIKPE